MIDAIKELLSKEGIAYRKVGDRIRIDLPNSFGELEIGVLDDNDTVVGLVGYPWHTHGDVLLYYGGSNEVEAIAGFVSGIFKGKHILVELLKDGKSIDKAIYDDRQSALKYLQPGEEVRIYN